MTQQEIKKKLTSIDWDIQDKTNRRNNSLPKETWIYERVLEQLRKLEADYVFMLIKTKKKKKDADAGEQDTMAAKAVPMTTLVRAIKVGRQRMLARCIFHDDKSPSLVIYTNNNSWYCFVCSIGGDAIDFVMKRDNVKFSEAVKTLTN